MIFHLKETQGNGEMVDQKGSDVIFRFCARYNNMLSIVAFPPYFAKELSRGNQFGSGLFENIQSVARKRV